MQSVTLLGFKLPVAAVCFVGHFIFFHIGCILLSLCDHFKLLQRYKLQRSDNDHSYFELLPRVLFNQLFLMLPAMLLFQYFGLGFQTTEALYSPIVYIVFSLWMALGHDVLFYLGHRFLLHSKWGFMHLGHDLHHSTKATIAISSMYMGVIDYILEIIIPYLVSC
jgi:sterol desaturase/sphingolipid hydroxylase (fatty acid hydroxylase superfamily)